MSLTVTPSTRPLPRLSHRLAIASCGGVAAAATLAGLAPQAAEAATSSTPVSFVCDLSVDNTPVPGRQDVAVSFTVDLDIPSPHQAFADMTVTVEGMTLPANLIPQDLTDVEIRPYVYLDAEVDDFGWQDEDWVAYPAFDKSQAQPLVAIDSDLAPGTIGIYEHRVTDFEAYIYGLDAGSNPITYVLECNTVNNAPVALTTAIFDINAAPTLGSNRFTAAQGTRVTVFGTNMLTQAPTNPAAQTQVFLGGALLGTFPIAQDGSFTGVVRIPDTAKGGNTQLVAVNGAKVSRTALTITVPRAAASVAPKKAKRGKSVKVRGSKFAAGESVRVTLKRAGKAKGKKSFATTARANAAGSFTKSVKLKKAAKGTWKVSAVGRSSGRKGGGRFSVK